MNIHQLFIIFKYSSLFAIKGLFYLYSPSSVKHVFLRYNIHFLVLMESFVTSK